MINKILSTIPLVQSAALADRNLKMLKKKKKKSTDFVEQGVENIIGASFISESSNFLS
jgi:hypothetical protein